MSWDTCVHEALRQDSFVETFCELIVVSGGVADEAAVGSPAFDVRAVGAV